MAATASAHEARLRDVFDLVATNDLTSFLTVVCRINPFDCSPGLKCLLERIKENNSNTNPYVVVLRELNVHTSTISTSRDASNNTPLHIAAGMGYTLMLEALLLECTCEVNAYNSFGFTSLHLASRQGHLECLKLLCAYGASVRLLTSLTDGDPFFRGRSAQFLAHWNGHPHVLRFLQKRFSPNTLSVLQSCDATAKNIDAGDKGHLKWVAAAQQEDMVCIAELFETLDCIGCASRPMQNCTNNANRKEAIASKLTLGTVRDIIHAVIPLDSDMTETQQFIFEGFLARGYVPTDFPEKGPENDNTLDPLQSIGSLIISRGHLGALRTMCQYGLRGSYLCSLALDIINTPDDSVPINLINMKYILAEAVARIRYEHTLEVYRQKCHSSSRKEKAWAAKCTLRTAQKALARVGIEPLSFKM